MSGQVPLRYEILLPGASLAVKMRPLIDLSHATLCAQAGLDPVRFYFDLPESAREAVGRGVALVNGRKIDGYIMMVGQDRPVGKLTLAYEAERFRDDDPRSRDDFERLG